MTTTREYMDLLERFYGYYAAGRYVDALNVAAREGARFPAKAALVEIWGVCMLARMGDARAALHVLEAALIAGHAYHEAALHGDPDLASLQGLPEFEALVARSMDQYRQARAGARAERIVLTPEGRGPWPLLIALHGNMSQAVDAADDWRPAVARGWMVVCPQSSQLAWLDGHYDWSDTARALAELRRHYAEVTEQYDVDATRVVLGGFSMGGQIALLAALEGGLPLRGIVPVEAWLPDVDTWQPRLSAAAPAGWRAFFIAGKDNAEYYDADRKLAEMLRAHGIACELYAAANASHNFPPDFAALLPRVLDFVSSGEAAPTAG